MSFSIFRRHSGEMIFVMHNLENYFNCVFLSLGSKNCYTAQDHSPLFNFMTIIFSKERKFNSILFPGGNFCIFLIQF